MAAITRPQDKLRTPQPLSKPKRSRMPWPLNLYHTAVGKKWVMGLTGVGLVGFVLVHMIGNLHIYEGQQEIADYAHALRTLGGHILPPGTVLWLLRVGLLVMFGLHIHSAVTLNAMNTKANSKYQDKRDYIAVTFASRTMRWTGPIIALFLLYHIADLTWGWWLGDNFVHGDPLGNIDKSFSFLPVALIYIVANVALALHIYHGVFSLFTSLGINSPKLNPMRRPLALGLATVILIGNLSFPLMVNAGVIETDDAITEQIIEQLHSGEDGGH